ncbi:conserved hypothetical protein [Gloeothece citriformis PCC 7424]|uniref:Glycosyltransferase n=2 Tax=Gloeothece TaxID=28070 RepID=B7KJK1_GLOC7|nr:TIGR04282 family arsenosugar biosynthesis glycosyltransferase [Gloeothece citriformis]ACK73678.1 conserved hypothetical protein [Gloeothece citriformis PCC 7424]
MDEEELIIFTRYPEPGKTKTRMIPVLGEQGAAELQRQMTEVTLEKAENLKSDRSIRLTLYFTGGNLDLMRKWLGSDLIYQSQCEGDLGQRMATAFERSFLEGIKRIVMIGIDCPQLDQIILNEAFNQLKHQDLVLGQAEDGGYYLIGLSRFIPQLFQGIDWGSDRVFAQTVAIAKQLQLKVSYLPVLRDVDRPEDLLIIDN